jgi:hypothetical protein
MLKIQTSPCFEVGDSEVAVHFISVLGQRGDEKEARM